MAWLALLVSQSIAGAETVLLTRDINPGAASSSPSDFAVVGDTLFFSANDGVNGFELWKSDGTEEGTVLVADINPPGGLGFGHSSPSSPVAVGAVLFFAANDGVTGRELWRSNGSAGGTDRVRDIVPGAVGSDPEDLLAVDGTVYFSAMGPGTGRELWRSDGTRDGTRMVADIASGFGASSTPRFLTRVGDAIFFSARQRPGPGALEDRRERIRDRARRGHQSVGQLLPRELDGGRRPPLLRSERRPPREGALAERRHAAGHENGPRHRARYRRAPTPRHSRSSGNVSTSRPSIRRTGASSGRATARGPARRG